MDEVGWRSESRELGQETKIYTGFVIRKKKILEILQRNLPATANVSAAFSEHPWHMPLSAVLLTIQDALPRWWQSFQAQYKSYFCEYFLPSPAHQSLPLLHLNS